MAVPVDDPAISVEPAAQVEDWAGAAYARAGTVLRVCDIASARASGGCAGAADTAEAKTAQHVDLGAFAEFVRDGGSIRAEWPAAAGRCFWHSSVSALRRGRLVSAYIPPAEYRKTAARRHAELDADLARLAEQ